ncbi:MAG TPA: TIGR00282 family metallophosphoesterase [Fimbriimonadales bacterium]|nr:TIGR00282 family metallophosphoesterase [Fimbriimonadales bacterium]
MRILFLGDIVGRVGRRCVQQCLPSLKETYKPDFVLANGENAAAGIGITPELADEMLGWGIDGITLGNHAFAKKEITPYLDQTTCVIRPANFPSDAPGKGWMTLTKGDHQLGVINLCGRIFMAEYDDPFRTADRLIRDLGMTTILIDFHAEATSEKNAFAWYMSDRASAVVGTHTHVQTADERILNGRTAYITDVGMCGAQESVIGMEREKVLKRFLTLMPEKFEPASGAGIINGVVIEVAEDGTATHIERVFWKDIT